MLCAAQQRQALRLFACLGCSPRDRPLPRSPCSRGCSRSSTPCSRLAEPQPAPAAAQLRVAAGQDARGGGSGADGAPAPIRPVSWQLGHSGLRGCEGVGGLKGRLNATWGECLDLARPERTTHAAAPVSERSPCPCARSAATWGTSCQRAGPSRPRCASLACQQVGGPQLAAGRAATVLGVASCAASSQRGLRCAVQHALGTAWRSVSSAILHRRRWH